MYPYYSALVIQLSRASLAFEVKIDEQSRSLIFLKLRISVFPKSSIPTCLPKVSSYDEVQYFFSSLILASSRVIESISYSLSFFSTKIGNGLNVFYPLNSTTFITAIIPFLSSELAYRSHEST